MKIFTLTFNEELFLPHFINHYRERFPNCDIVVYDNMSTDNTVEIAKEFDCEVIPYDTKNKLSDGKYLEIKNNCWRDESGWVLVADCDELLDICENDLINETASIISVEAYNMVNLNDNLDIESIVNGVRSTSYDKAYCFNSDKIKEINYSHGCHDCRPIGVVKYSKKKYKAFHYKYINLEYMILRHGIFAKRLSDENILRGFGAHYNYSPERITNEFLDVRKQSKKIR